MEHTLVQTHPWLVPWLAAKGPLGSLAVVTPFIGVDVWLLSQGVQGAAPTVVAMLSGVVAWTFFEYAVHRWLYHTRFRSPRMRWLFETFHLYHHRNLADGRVLNARLFSWPSVLTFAVLFWCAAPTTALAAATHLGMLGAYVFYEWVHHAIHLKPHPRGYLAFIQRYHLHHHYKKWNANFGNTSPLWDVLLGTYDARWRTFEVTPQVEAAMQMHQRESLDHRAGVEANDAEGAISSA
jgi:4-hydroxysphinganine ceramide fatty acyl 2-hydroxylase